MSSATSAPSSEWSRRAPWRYHAAAPPQTGPAVIDFRHHRRRHGRRLRQSATLDLMQDANHLDGMLIDGSCDTCRTASWRQSCRPEDIGQGHHFHSSVAGSVPDCASMSGWRGIRPPPAGPSGRIAKREKPARDALQRLRMHIGILFKRKAEDLQHPQRPVTEHEIGIRLTRPARMAKWPRSAAAEWTPSKPALAKIGFHGGADDAGKVADITRRK